MFVLKSFNQTQTWGLNNLPGDTVHGKKWSIFKWLLLTYNISLFFILFGWHRFLLIYETEGRMSSLRGAVIGACLSWFSCKREQHWDCWWRPITLINSFNLQPCQVLLWTSPLQLFTQHFPEYFPSNYFWWHSTSSLFSHPKLSLSS